MLHPMVQSVQSRRGHHNVLSMLRQCIQSSFQFVYVTPILRVQCHKVFYREEDKPTSTECSISQYNICVYNVRHQGESPTYVIPWINFGGINNQIS